MNILLTIFLCFTLAYSDDSLNVKDADMNEGLGGRLAVASAFWNYHFAAPQRDPLQNPIPQFDHPSDFPEFERIADFYRTYSYNFEMKAYGDSAFGSPLGNFKTLPFNYASAGLPTYENGIVHTYTDHTRAGLPEKDNVNVDLPAQVEVVAQPSSPILNSLIPRLPLARVPLVDLPILESQIGEIKATAFLDEEQLEKRMMAQQRRLDKINKSQ